MCFCSVAWLAVDAVSLLLHGLQCVWLQKHTPQKTYCNTAAGLCSIGSVRWLKTKAVQVRRQRIILDERKKINAWDDADVIHFVNHQGCLFGNVLYCSHIYGQPCIAPDVNYFFSTILLLHCFGFVWH